MSWFVDHPILSGLLTLALLTIAGVAVIVWRSVTLVRVARDSRRRVDPSVRAISQGLRDAEHRVGRLQEHQGDLASTVERVGVQAAELKRLLAVAGKAVAVLRAPLKYFGK